MCICPTLDKTIERTLPSVYPNVMMVLIMCQSWFISCNKCTTPVQDFDSGGGCQGQGKKGEYENSVLSTQFFYPLKIS